MENRPNPTPSTRRRLWATQRVRAVVEVGEPLLQFHSRQRPRIKVTLHLVTAYKFQLIRQRRVVNPFSKGPEVHTASNLNDRLDDGAILLVSLEIGDERAVDLEFVHFEPLQIGQTGEEMR